MGEGGGGRGHEGRFSRDPVPVYSAGGHRKQFWRREGFPLFDVVCPLCQDTDRPGVRLVPEGSGERRKMEDIGCISSAVPQRSLRLRER